jgi:hypothetical protein
MSHLATSLRITCYAHTRSPDGELLISTASGSR